MSGQRNGERRRDTGQKAVGLVPVRGYEIEIRLGLWVWRE